MSKGARRLSCTRWHGGIRKRLSFPSTLEHLWLDLELAPFEGLQSAKPYNLRAVRQQLGQGAQKCTGLRRCGSATRRSRYRLLFLLTSREGRFRQGTIRPLSRFARNEVRSRSHHSTPTNTHPRLRPGPEIGKASGHLPTSECPCLIRSTLPRRNVRHRRPPGEGTVGETWRNAGHSP